jgi:hypothetical protein
MAAASRSEPESETKYTSQQLDEEEVVENFGMLKLGESGVSRFHGNAASAYLVSHAR